MLEADGIPTRVVSMPCVEWFEAQDQEYRDSVLPPSVKARVSVEAGHRACRGTGGSATPARSSRIEHYGASADYKTLFREFGFTTEHVVTAARTSLDRVSPRDRVTDIVRPRPPPSERSHSWPPTRGSPRSPRRACPSGSTTCPASGCTSGNLAELITDKSVVGVTTNPTIFAAALANGQAYDAQLRELAARGASVDDTVREVTAGDVRRPATCSPAPATHTGGVDGRVSIEVDPRSRTTPRRPSPRRWTCGRPSTGPTC